MSLGFKFGKTYVSGRQTLKHPGTYLPAFTCVLSELETARGSYLLLGANTQGHAQPQQ